MTIDAITPHQAQMKNTAWDPGGFREQKRSLTCLCVPLYQGPIQHRPAVPGEGEWQGFGRQNHPLLARGQAGCAAGVPGAEEASPHKHSPAEGRLRQPTALGADPGDVCGTRAAPLLGVTVRTRGKGFPVRAGVGRKTPVALS